MLEVASYPIVLVIISGGSVDLSFYKNHPKVGAIIFGGYLGQAGGQALADVLFGQYNPSGRLPQTFYDSDFVNAMSIYDMHMRPTFATGNPGRTYRFFTGASVYEFGFGLSYTTFHKTWSVKPLCELDVAVITRKLKEDLGKGTRSCVVTINITVTNVGDVAGEDVILVYADPPQAGKAGRPLKSLVAFERTSVVAAGQNGTVQFCLEAKVFALADKSGNWNVEPGNWTIHVDKLQHYVNVRGSASREAAIRVVEEEERKPLPRSVVWE